MAALRASDPPLPTDEQVHELLRQRIDVEERGVGIAVGLIDGQTRRTICHGSTAVEGGKPVDAETVFEIGSVTKSFTDLVLADMVRKGEVTLDEPIAKLLPATVKVPARGDRQITLLDLATHRSALPRMPGNFHPADPGNPYADYTPELLYEFLSRYTLPRDIGSKMEYSNLGVGLLGHALSLRAGKSYEDTVVERICRPLGMADTRITLTPAMRERLAQPYDERLAPARNWDIATISGAGALRSDVNDMLRFVAAELDGTTFPAMADTQTMRNHDNSAKLDLGLGWFIDHTNEPAILWHNGATGGYHAFVGFCPARKTGIVVLSNTGLDVDDIGLHLLDARRALTPPPPPPKARTAVAIKPEVADRYVGRYQLGPDLTLMFAREGDRYFLNPPEGEKDEVFPESETDFFSKSFDGQVTFVHDADGRWNAMVLHQGGIPDQTAQRLP